MSAISGNSPLISMNLISIKLDFENAVKACYEAGYGGIGLWFDKVCEYGVDRACDLLQKVPIKVTHLINAGPFNQTSEKDYLAAREVDREKIRVSSKLGAETLLAYTGPINDMSYNEAFRQLTRSLRDLVDAAQAYGVKIGLEPLNYILKGDSFLHTLTETMDIIEEIDNPYVGVFFDTYHLWHEPGLLETLKRAKGKIVGCQISDFRTINRSIYDRALMGDGVIPIRRLLDAVKEQGWDKWYDIEIFSHELWQMEPKEFLKLAMKKYEKLWL
jgi:sugar phosphate isomerase/epimerase